MKVYRFILLFILGLATTVLRAQDMSIVSDSIFFEYAKSLKNRGNEYYALSNRIGIKQVIDEYQKALAQRKAAGNLTDEMECYFMQDITKLNGDYHYENSDFDKSSYTEAEKYFKQYRDYYLSHHRTYIAGQGLYVAHQELAQLFYKQGRYQEACDEMKEVLTTAKSYMQDEDEPFDKLSQYAICQARVNQFDEAISNIDEVLDNYENIDSERYGEALRKKAKILMLREEQGGQTSKSEALDCYHRFFILKKTDALAHFMGMSSEEREMYWMKIRPFVTDCYRLEDADAGFLYDVTLFAKGLLLQLDSAGGGRQNFHATWQMIQERLKPDACAIEFIQYEKYGLQQMGALVLKKTGEPIFVKMAAPDSVMNFKIMVKGETISVERLIHSIHGADSNSRMPRNKLYSDSTRFNNLIWNSEIIRVIGTTLDIWFAPDGYSHQLAIEYMLPQQMNGKRIHRLSSTRSLLEKKIDVNDSKALVVGGVNYLFGGDIQLKEGNDSLAYNFVKQQKGMNFKYLPKSLYEAETIAKNRNKEEDLVLIADNATEQKFRQKCSDYSLVHFSTHGYFGAADASQGTDLKPCYSDMSLSESLLALAGVQYNINDESFNHNYQDGILSAKEIASLDMSKTKLAVLSCCETGLGYVSADGVYGIQRGFKNAGVKAIICTLWDIDDDASNFFMVNFHRNITQGIPLYKSFYNARESMKNYRDDNTEILLFNPSSKVLEQKVIDDDFSEPSFMDAFILIDAIE